VAEDIAAINLAEDRKKKGVLTYDAGPELNSILPLSATTDVFCNAGAAGLCVSVTVHAERQQAGCRG